MSIEQMPTQGDETEERKKVNENYFLSDLKNASIAELDTMVERYGFDEEYLQSPKVLEAAREGVELAKKENRENVVKYLKEMFSL